MILITVDMITKILILMIVIISSFKSIIDMLFINTLIITEIVAGMNNKIDDNHRKLT